MLADIADEIKEREVFHPVIIVHHLGCIRLLAVEVKEFCKLFFYGFLVMAEGFFIKEFALLAFHRRVANHACCSSNKCNRFVPGSLEMLEHHHSDKVSDMKAVCGRVNAEICRGHLFFKLFFCSWHHLVDHATPCEFVYEVHEFGNYSYLSGCKVS